MSTLLTSTLLLLPTSASPFVDLEDLANAPEYLRNLASRYDELSDLEKLWATASKEPGARLPYLITEDLKAIMICWEQLNKGYTDLLFGNTSLNMSHHSQPYGGFWRDFFAFETALKIFVDVVKLAIFSLYFVMDSKSYNSAQIRIDTGRFRELVRIQESVIASSAAVQFNGVEGFHTLPLLRYLARIKSLIYSDPTDHWKFNPQLESVVEMANTQPEEQKKAMQVLKDQMVSRVVDWKGHNPTTFGSLQLRDTFEGCNGVKPDEALKPFDCYLFETVFIACKVAGPKEGDNKSGNEDLVLKLKGRIFFNSILKIDRHVSKSGDSLLITYEANGSAFPLSVCRIRCKTDAIVEQWYQVILRQVRWVKTPSWSGEMPLSKSL